MTKDQLEKLEELRTQILDTETRRLVAELIEDYNNLKERKWWQIWKIFQ